MRKNKVSFCGNMAVMTFAHGGATNHSPGFSRSPTWPNLAILNLLDPRPWRQPETLRILPFCEPNLAILPVCFLTNIACQRQLKLIEFVFFFCFFCSDGLPCLNETGPWQGIATRGAENVCLQRKNVPRG